MRSPKKQLHAEPSAHPPGANGNGNKQLVHRFIEECWNQGNLSVVPEMLAEQVRIHDPVFPDLTSGARNMRNHIEICRRAFPDIRFTIDDTISEHGEVVIHWTARGTHEGDFLGMHPTHRKAVITGTSIYRIEGSKIAEEWVHWNLMTMMEQLGISAAAPASAPASVPAAVSASASHRGASRRAKA